MVTASSYQVDDSRPAETPRDDQPPNTNRLQRAMARDVTLKFKRIAGLPVIVTPMWTNRDERKSAIRQWGYLPPCRDNRRQRACLRCRYQHLQVADATEPKTSCQHCPFGRVCVVAPLVIEGQVKAHGKLSLPPETAGRSVGRYVELLDVLMENAFAHASLGVAPLVDVDRAGSGTRSGSIRQFDAADDGCSDVVHQALMIIDEHFENPDLTVTAVARRMGLNRDYLSHVFCVQTGERMSRRIFLRRMTRARELLSNTSMQVRQVAISSGFLNTDWFSHTFHELEGITPSQFRRKARQR